jgi:hypothetical protein
LPIVPKSDHHRIFPFIHCVTDETTFSKIGGGAIMSRNNADGWNRINGTIVTGIKLDLKPPTIELFFSAITSTRSLYLVINANEYNKERKDELVPSIFLNEKVYTIACAKTSKESNVSRPCPNMEILTLTYMVESGKDIPTMNYKEELEHRGDSGSFEVNKAASRLSLFTSQAASMHTISATNHFEMIPERFNVGCGFIPEERIDALSPLSRIPSIWFVQGCPQA